MKKLFIGFVVFVLAVLFIVSVKANPTGVAASDINAGVSETWSGSSASSVTAQGGHVQSVNITGKAQTVLWQGFYGVVNNTIVLANAAGTAMLDWKDASPSGEVYFGESNVDWSNVAAGTHSNLITEQVTKGYANTSGVDNLTETYTTSTSHPDFKVGSTTITGAPAVRTYDGSGTKNSYISVFLWDPTNGNAVYTGLINQSQTGFNGNDADYQVVIPTAASSTRTMYVYVELE